MKAFNTLIILFISIFFVSAFNTAVLGAPPMVEKQKTGKIVIKPTPASGAEKKVCWCCYNGKVDKMTPVNCKERRGRCYSSKEEAIKACRSQDNCRIKYPRPRIRYDHKDAAGRIYIPVVNWTAYPDQMFREAPELPPCGMNKKASRTWVDIFDAATNKRIYGFCALGSNDGLQRIWFMPKAKRGKVYIILKDRACRKIYKSNTIAWPGRRPTELGPQPEPPDIR